MRLCWFPPAESEVLSCWLEMPTSFLGTCQQEETGVGAVVREWGPRGPGQALRAAPRARVGPSLPSPSTSVHWWGAAGLQCPRRQVSQLSVRFNEHLNRDSFMCFWGYTSKCGFFTNTVSGEFN